MVFKFSRHLYRNSCCYPIIIYLCCFAFLLTTKGIAQIKNKIVIPQIDEPIDLDGLLNEPAWSAIKPIIPVMHSPVFEGELTERTEIRLAYDDDYLYMGANLYDSEPEKIQGPALNRDNHYLYNDLIGILLDTFNDKENALGFFTTPRGIRTDLAVTLDADGRFPLNFNWNTFWDVEVTSNQEGWFAEFRIPLSSLRFQENNGQTVMGLISWRLIARKNEYHIFPSIPPTWGRWSIYKPSQSQEILFENIHNKNPLYITPYALGGFTRHSELNDDETAYNELNDFTKRIGLDIKYGLTSNFTADLTINTDFAQVEADDQQVNLTRFSLYFPEKRQFFLERASIFEFKTGGRDRVFYSRQIGIYEEELVDIYGGIRLIGRLNKWDLGFLNMQTAESSQLSSENFGVLRLRRQVINENSYAGGIFTSRIGNDGSKNFAAGVDGIFRVFEDEYVTANIVHTYDTYQNPDSSSNLFILNWERRSRIGFGYDLGIKYVGREYNPGIGFVSRNNYTFIGDRIFYGWLPEEDSQYYRHAIYLGCEAYLNNNNGALESLEVGPSWWLETKSDYGSWIAFDIYYEDLPDTFDLDDNVFIAPGHYTFYGLKGFYYTPSGGLLRADVFLNAGMFYDGWRISLDIEPQYNVSNHLELGLSYEYDYVQFQQRNQLFQAHIARFRTKYMFSTTVWASAFIQYNNVDDEIIFNFRIRYNPREGNDIYLVFNEGRNTERYKSYPVRPHVNNRTLLLKFNYTFRGG